MTNSSNCIEVITSVQRRRRWTAAEKVRMVEETFEPGMTVSRWRAGMGSRQNSGSPGDGWWRRVR
jgi:transposase-like protein